MTRNFKPITTKSAQYFNFLKSMQRLRDSSSVSSSSNILNRSLMHLPRRLQVLISTRFSLIIKPGANQEANLGTWRWLPKIGAKSSIPTVISSSRSNT